MSFKEKELDVQRAKQAKNKSRNVLKARKKGDMKSTSLH